MVLTAECVNGKITVTQEVTAPVTSLCPCSKEISKYGAHNQRSHVSIIAEVETNFPIEKQIEMIESCASCQVWGLLKRSDEKYVTEHAYENPKFVEDLVRDVAIDVRLNRRFLPSRSKQKTLNRFITTLPLPLCTLTRDKQRNNPDVD